MKVQAASVVRERNKAELEPRALFRLLCNDSSHASEGSLSDMNKTTTLAAEAASSNSAPEHDRLAWRLTDILVRFNQGEQLGIDVLAVEYGVHRRTILRDLTERFSFLPIEKIGSRYTLDTAYLGRLSFKDIERFAALAGLKGLFPSLDTQFFRELFDSRLQDTLSVHGPSYEDLRSRLDDFRTVQQAIKLHRRLRFNYAKDEGVKQVQADPYRLINSNGVWYLAAVDADQPKAYAFGKLKAPQILDVQFTPNADIRHMLEAEDSIWLKTRKTEVILAVAPPAASYFRRRKLIAQQVVEKELEDGGMIVSGKFAHPNQIFPIVRYWLPHVRIVSPENWQKELETGLRGYLTPKEPFMQREEC